MTIGCWILIGLFIVLGIMFTAVLAFNNGTTGFLIGLVVSLIVIGLVVGGCLWYMSTGEGQRALTDQKSNLNNGIDRVVVVYTADGQELARYEGKIDIDMNDGGYVKFDFDGKRYIYYNCFIETIAEIK